MTVRELTDPEEKSKACEQIIRHLPDWFGMPESNKNYIKQMRDKDVFAVEKDGAAIGLIALKYHFGETAEVWWMGLLPEHHRSGLGTLLIEAAKKRAKEKNCKNLALNTLSPRSPDPYYARTRAFYDTRGFRPLVEFNEDDPDNPMMWMVLNL